MFSSNKYNFIFVSNRIVKKYKKYLVKVLKDFGLPPAEIDVITFLINKSPEFDTAKDISIYRGISKALVSKSVNSLIIKKFIIPVTDIDDKRIIHLKLTDNAQKIIDLVNKSNKEFYSLITKDISPEDMEIFQKVNRLLLDNIININF